MKQSNFFFSSIPNYMEDVEAILFKVDEGKMIILDTGTSNDIVFDADVFKIKVTGEEYSMLTATSDDMISSELFPIDTELELYEGVNLVLQNPVLHINKSLSELGIVGLVGLETLKYYDLIIDFGSNSVYVK